ncbi:MAG: TonB-dependent receptor [Bryobacterales bacterium]|nr:TonB-dependent receptor [Bryobacterales bacterium]
MLCSWHIVLMAQPSASVSGSVHNSSGSVVVDTSVILSAPANGIERRAQTDARGRFTFPALPIGDYELALDTSAFAPLRRSFRLGVGDAIDFEFTLVPSTLVSSIEVSTGENNLRTTSRGFNLGATLLSRLPINGRDYARFTLLSPGAVPRSNQVADLTFDGLRTGQNQFAIDGVDAGRVDQPVVANGSERGARLLTGSLESIAEFRVQSGNYEAQFGRAAGAWVNIATKSGSNDLHAGLFEFLRNDLFDARNFFNRKPDPQAAFRFHNFGANLSGPLLRDHLFFWTGYEGSRQRIGAVGTGTVPSERLRQEIAAASSALAPVLDMIPRGTAPTANALIDGYITTRTLAIREDTASVKLDFRPNAADFAFVRINRNDSRVLGPLFTVNSGSLGLRDSQDVPVTTTNVALGYQRIVSVRVLLDLLAGMQRVETGTNADAPGLPLFLVTGLTIQPGSRGSGAGRNTSYQAGGSFTLAAGAHTFKAGSTHWRIRLQRASTATSVLVYSSLPDFTANRVSSAILTGADPGSALHSRRSEGFVQDTWRLRRLTLDLGFRHDYTSSPSDPAAKARPYDIRAGALAAPGAPFFHAPTASIAPRLGLAWQPFPAVTIRSCYGLFYQAYPLGSAMSLLTNTLPGSTTLVRQEFPALAYPVDPLTPGGQRPIPSVWGIEPNRRDTYVQQWNFSTLLGGDRTHGHSVQIAYVGNRGVHIARPANLNLLNPATGRRPNPAFANITIESSSGNSTYHALQTSWSRRAASGLQGTFAYSWSHLIDDVPDAVLFPATPQNLADLRAERGSGSSDIRHGASFSIAYPLPFAARAPRGLLSTLAGGWELLGIGMMRSGVATTITIGTNTFGDGNFVNQRPDAVPGTSPYTANKSVDGWYSSNSFRMPVRGRFGNLGRGTVAGPALVQLDASLAKTFPIRELFAIQLRVEAFNAVNHPLFAQPTSVFGDPSFGRIFSTIGRTLGMGTARQFQIALKLKF